jgi:hypothetical protein
MSVNLSPVGNGFQFFTNNGEPLVGGKLDTYQAGSTTPLTTFTDSSGLIPNTNPIILGTDGRPPDTIWLSEGFFYKFVLSDANDVQIQVYDNLYGIIGVSPPAATPIPSGGIILWSGSIGSIPAGYVLCNGNNSTPDLERPFYCRGGFNLCGGCHGWLCGCNPANAHAHGNIGGHRSKSPTFGSIRWKWRIKLCPWWPCWIIFCYHKQPASNRLASRLQPPTPTQEPLALTPTCPRTMRFATL